MDKFRELLKKDIILLDGAMGTMIKALGQDMNKIHVMESPELIYKIHKMYVDEGADIIYCASFNLNGYKLKDSGYTVNEAVKSAVRIAKDAVSGTDTLVALGLGPIGRMIEPAGDMTFDEAYDYFKEMILAGKDGSDLVVIETLSDLYEAKAAILAVKENCDLPVICTMTFEKDKRTFTGMNIPSMVATLEGLSVDCLGVNCSLGPFEMIDVVMELCELASVPVVVKPNAGMPDPETGEYLLSPSDFCKAMKKMIPYGVRIIGGCCGTTPAFIKLLKEEIVDVMSPFREFKKRFVALSTGFSAFTFDEPKVVGERINPTGKRDFKEALLNNDMDFILKEGIRQNEAGAHILDVNLGLPLIDEEEMMVKAIKELQKVANLPLQIDSSDPMVIEAGLRAYNGRAIVNSVTGKEESLNKILPLVKKYGAMVVGLTLDEKGIPKTHEERFNIAVKIMERAKSYGIPKEDIFIDCLTLTVSSEQDKVQETLTAMRRVKDELGMKTILGVSNISFGLPNRDLINRTFLVMALENGLDLAIINPLDEEMMGAYRAFKVLKAIDENSLSYIENYSKEPVFEKKEVHTDFKEGLMDAIKKGLVKEAEEIAFTLLKDVEPMDVVRTMIVPALDIVGDGFESGDIFLPQLLLSAQAAQGAFSEIKKKMEENREVRKQNGTILLATVKGDIHDIGKNIVRVLLENYDFKVIDLGKDVDKDIIIERVKEEKAELLGLSALMTVSLKAMEETINLIHKEVPSCKVMVGGAVLTEEYAKKIGADYFGEDAKRAVDIANIHFNVL